MAERFTTDLLFILIVLLVAALLGFLLGYLPERRRRMRRIAELNDEIEGLQEKIRRLEEEKVALNGKVNGLEKDKAVLTAEIRKLQEEIESFRQKLKGAANGHAGAGSAKPSDGEPAPPGADELRKKTKPDDLTAVVGIGPKISQLLVNRGITTWNILSETSSEYLKEILDNDGGEDYRIHDPSTWPHQALLLHEGRWEEFSEVRARLKK